MIVRADLSRQTVPATGSASTARLNAAGFFTFTARWFEIAAQAVRMGTFDGRHEKTRGIHGERETTGNRSPDRRGRNSAAGAQLGAPLVLAAGPADQAASGRLLRAGHAPRRHRRALVRLDDAGHQRGGPAGRRSELRRVRQGPVHAARRRRRAGGRTRRRADLERVPPLARLFEILRQHGADSPSHAPKRRAGEARAARRASPSRITFRRSSTRSATTFPTPFWAWSRGRPSRTSSAASSGGTTGTTASSTCRRRTG